MKHQVILRLNRVVPIVLLVILAITACQPAVPTQSAATSAPATSVPAPSSTAQPAATTESASPTPGAQAATTPQSNDVLFDDEFTNPGSGWDDAKLGDYFVGYHGPDWYHIEIDSPNEKVAISEPSKTSYENVTLVLQAFAVAAKTAPTGDFRFGLSFRRSGGQYYAFTISPTTKKWAMLKVSPEKVETLQEGTDDSIHGLDGKDVLRVDAIGSNFLLHINDHLVAPVTDSSYASGEVGLFAQTIDSPKIHIHDDVFTIEKAPAELPDLNVKFQDNFTNPGSGWDDAKLGDYFVGYHGPDWYHIEIDSSNEKVAISEPSRTKYDDITLELQAFAVAAKTAPTGDFRFGLAFRRSGEEYYAFTISPTTKKWAMLKVSPDNIETLKEGIDDSIHGLDGKDVLRVDAMGSSFLLHINDHLVAPVTDSSYASGEVGLFAQTLDSPKIHIHDDTFTIRTLQLDLSCTINGGTFNVRTGPGKAFSQVDVLSAGATLQPIGVSPNREWIQIKLKDGTGLGWVSFAEGLMSCTPSLDLFPIINP